MHAGNTRKLSAAERADTMSNVLFDIATRQLTSPKPMREEQLLLCEADRLMDVLGPDSTLKIIEVADLRLNEVSMQA